MTMEMAASRTVGRPAEEVFAYFADASNNPEWQNGMATCEWVTKDPIGVGSRYVQRARFMGREIKSVFEVTEFEPGSMIRIETIESTFPIQVTRTVIPIDAGSCRVEAHITGGPQRGLMKWLEPLAAGKAQQSVDDDYDRLVQLLESRTASTD